MLKYGTIQRNEESANAINNSLGLLTLDATPERLVSGS